MYGGAEQLIEALVRRGASIKEGMQELLSLCERTLPAPLWIRFHGINYEGDFQRLTRWLRRLLRDEPPGKEITGLWLGLHNPTLNGRASCGLYLAGSTRFRPDGPCPDWPCGPEYWPQGRYANSDVLRFLYEESPIDSDDLNAQAEVALCQGFASLVAVAWCRGPMRDSLRGGAAYRAVAVGHDSGDVHLIDVLREP